ncbi:acetyl-CoA carboxylase biotin carboxylase subunit [Paenibacillus apiarius]|uniref:biotin carboxylase n=1 Tax=Paenibacillus apiarius TaxID=46240 RepID=A0ABT4E1W9_9BACL|nr:acetyl-CoA carboxylase biotin carboxylase subunit [Paenibacillus apiarius]MCY9516436.1 acetyl-CoA carboxylase biotin carboxylase subunit [Paenibacillus apiarius]MCY9523490.1 acetyl-CoA carboxylase biotin carboxylase subunit [Paenibacillus apiarius]MCY9554290.1 acetyl-CoA carboxylase biotin carboxylase subunit [Paenibacillus apiarius]MCY9561615.1 acetyl-CoA carboxylase biotin carboxylase subunit [Paenibacillus apiarius]MCY9687035.1 acetyl-CoA carboxylase biotin carboxylase subunit [Paenibaci
MFKKILIANRGEIAARVIRTCQSLGIATVSIYSKVDKEAPHVTMADEAYEVGNPRVTDSYLKIGKILEIARLSKADAIHPGYGLLSENAEFAHRCEEAGIVFIGPPADVISRMGSKIQSRNTMEKAGVPVVPGIAYPLADAEEAAREARRIGYPVMLKASAGGGGIGMQIVDNESEMKQAFEGNRKRASDFFGDGAMYIEKVIENPRHIEIQILADSYGNTVHLGERECSIQRRHQKVVEEAPSAYLDELTRSKMGEAAVRAAQSIGYRNAGTIEFLVDGNKNFYFLEMNTRLQVEHTITEEITGLDLVAEQLRIAAGHSLNFGQSDVTRDGHAIEVRIYAEDPKTFFPSPGVITKLAIPEGDGIRHELAVHEGSMVTPFYDPMIAKLVVKGKDRGEAIDRLQQALAQYQVQGIKTNIPMLQEVIAHPAFRSGDTTTGFVAKYLLEKT